MNVLGTEAHRAAHEPLELLLLRQLRDDRVRRAWVELGGVGVGKSEHVPSELDDGHLEAEAYSEVRQALLAGVAHAEDLPFDPPHPETAGHDDTMNTFKLRSDAGSVEGGC